VSTARWIGLMLGLAGAAIVILSRSAVEATSYTGLLAAAGAMLGMTVGTLCERRFGTPQHPVTANLVQNAVALVVTLPVAAAFERMSVQWTWGLAASTAYLVLANSLLALGLLLAMVRRGEATRVSALFFLVPPIAAAVAWLVVDEAMPPAAWTGFGVAAVGVAIANRARPLSPTRPPSRAGST
jgi:drug/metabolite transporter (DMT)-like permease